MNKHILRWGEGITYLYLQGHLGTEAEEGFWKAVECEMSDTHTSGAFLDWSCHSCPPKCVVLWGARKHRTGSCSRLKGLIRVQAFLGSHNMACPLRSHGCLSGAPRGLIPCSRASCEGRCRPWGFRNVGAGEMVTASRM